MLPSGKSFLQMRARERRERGAERRDTHSEREREQDAKEKNLGCRDSGIDLHTLPQLGRMFCSFGIRILPRDLQTSSQFHR